MYRIWVANAAGEEYPLGEGTDNVAIAVDCAIFAVQTLRVKKVIGATVMVLAHDRGVWACEV